MPQRGTIPSLHGLRGVSILLVLVGHLYGTANAPLPKLTPLLGDYASLGVLVFFVLSGFLITSLLLEEEARNGRVSLRQFYWRRTLRIFPPAYAFIAFVALAGLASADDLIVAATYMSNMSPKRPWVLGHLWSLAVEEQFYLLWPVAFVLLRPQARYTTIVTVVLFAPLARMAAFYLGGIDLPLFPCVADSIAVGTLLALRRQDLHASAWYLRFRDLPLFAILLPIVVLNVVRFHVFKASFLATTILVALIAVLIDRCVVHYATGFGRLLNSAPFIWLGTMSYSLYLWQQMFLNRNSIAWYTSFPFNIVLAFAAGMVSYHAVERPALMLRSWSALPGPASVPRR